MRGGNLKVVVLVVVACPECKHSCVLLSGGQGVEFGPVISWVFWHPVAEFLGLVDDTSEVLNSLAPGLLLLLPTVPHWGICTG